MKYSVVILVLFILSCSTNNLNSLDSHNLLICDPYLVELENKSRYIIIKGIVGNRTEAKYLTTEQRHSFSIDDLILKLNFYHRLIEDQISQESFNKYQIREIKQTTFGVVEIILTSQKKNHTFHELRQLKIVESIEIEEFENKEVAIEDQMRIDSIPESLLNIGAISFKKSKERKLLTLTVPNDSEDEIIEKLYTNNELIYKYLDDSDIVNIKSKKSPNEVLRSYILVDSFGKDLDLSGWCGMGPKIKRFECIYLKNHNL